MSSIEVIENFLKDTDFQELRKFFLSPRSQWRFIDFVVSKEQDNQKKDGYFVHSFRDLHPTTFEERFPISPNINVLEKIMFKKIKMPMIQIQFIRKMARQW